jgi:hypothetical protein
MVRGGHETAPLQSLDVGLICCGSWNGAGRAQDRAPTVPGYGI